MTLWQAMAPILRLALAASAVARPHLERAGRAVWLFLRRHANSRDAAVGLMIAAWPLGQAGDAAGVIPDGSAWAASTLTATLCGAFLWWRAARLQRKWRERGGAALTGGACACDCSGRLRDNAARTDELESQLAELFMLMEQVAQAAGASRARPARARLRLVGDPDPGRGHGGAASLRRALAAVLVIPERVKERGHDLYLALRQ